MAKKITQSARMDYVRERLKKDPRWAKRALLVIYSKQTESEKSTGTTHQYNNVGFAGNDAEFMSSMAVQLKNKGFLSPKQMVYLHKRIHKYCRQIIENSNGAKLDALIQTQ